MLITRILSAWRCLSGREAILFRRAIPVIAPSISDGLPRQLNGRGFSPFCHIATTNMEVILRQDVTRLGKAGSVIKVKDGFARNYLIPNGLAMSSCSASLKILEQDKQKKSLALEKAKQEASDLFQKLSGLSLTISALATEDDKLYGSISSLEISRALSEEGFAIDKNSIILEEPINALGVYQALVKLHPEVSGKIKVWVVKK